ncbi:MAG: CpsB/CapC family capsule biosynthesis tyrosine phosphatase [Chitinophagaceae bacterium]|nr:histidinol phosphatase [Chitinophagaceae bacterium]
MGLFKFNKKGQTADFSQLQTDMHSHLIPDIDDGVENMAMAIEMIKEMQELGYTKLITTPHIMWDMYKNTRDIILSKLEILQKEVSNAGLYIEIGAAAEYFLDEHVAALLKDKIPLLTIHQNWVLCEFSMAFPAHGLKEILFEMQMQGYQPVIAHPERYIYLENSKGFYEELKNIGCLFQLNLTSMTGFYGHTPKELAKYLLKNEYYDLVGTDLHNKKYLEALKSPKLDGILKNICSSNKIRNKEL